MLIQYDGVLIKRENCRQTNTQMIMKAETGVMRQRPRRAGDCQQTTRKWEKIVDRLPHCPYGEPTSWHPLLGFLAPRTVRKGISIVSATHSVVCCCGNPWKPIQWLQLRYIGKWERFLMERSLGASGKGQQWNNKQRKKYPILWYSSEGRRTIQSGVDEGAFRRTF